MEPLVIAGNVVFVVVGWELVIAVVALTTLRTLHILLIAVVVVTINRFESLQLRVAPRSHQTQCGE